MSEQPGWKERVKFVTAAPTAVASANPLLRMVDEFVATLNESPWLRAELRDSNTSPARALVVGPKYRRDTGSTLLVFSTGPHSITLLGADHREISDEESLAQFFGDFVETSSFHKTVAELRDMQQEDVPGRLRVRGLLEDDPRDVSVRVDASKHNEMAKRALDGKVEIPFDVDFKLDPSPGAGVFDARAPYDFLESGGFGLRINALRRFGDVLRAHGDIVPLADLPSPGGLSAVAAAPHRHAAPSHDGKLEGYLSEVVIENVRSLASVRWAVEPRPGWNVILGDNGSGKSTFLRAIALGLLLPEDASALRLNFSEWVRGQEERGKVSLEAKAWLEGQPPRDLAAHAAVSRREKSLIRGPAVDMGPHIHTLFTAGFGPFRRFTGGDDEYERQFRAYPRVMRHLSLFDERASLSESLEWLTKLRARELEDASPAAFLYQLKMFINQEGFLPNNVWLHDITVDDVVLVDGNGWKGSIKELSDGYRSVLSLTFELIRQLAAHWGQDRVFGPEAKAVVAPGIVLIDEVDAHLHPSWQRRIGLWLREHFPRVQFIVTTHSPLVCQAADVGTVFRLPRPGTDEEGRMVTGVELDRLLYGDMVDAYATEAIGGIGRSDKAQGLLEQLAALRRKEIAQGLTSEERKDLRRLRAIFPAAEDAA